MHVINSDSAEQALVRGLTLIQAYGRSEESRNGPVMVMSSPVATANRRPLNRVMLAPWRDANPFFHLVESAWMLAGRNDSASLTPYVAGMAKYAQPDGTLHGAYGKRWRTTLGIDQLNVVVRRLKLDRTDRQCVLQMWDAGVLGETGVEPASDLTGEWADRPCNTHAYLRVRRLLDSDVHGHAHYLDLTVCCRSNDLVWGAHGANAVHFSYLHEYLADRIGVGVGVMYQLSNNYHAYVSELDKIYERCSLQGHSLPRDTARYGLGGDVMAQPMRLHGEPDVDIDLGPLWIHLDALHRSDRPGPPWLARTAFGRLVYAAAMAHALYRAGHTKAAIEAAREIEASDWRAACVEWLERRIKHGQ